MVLTKKSALYSERPLSYWHVRSRRQLADTVQMAYDEIIMDKKASLFLFVKRQPSMGVSSQIEIK